MKNTRLILGTLGLAGVIAAGVLAAVRMAENRSEPAQRSAVQTSEEAPQEIYAGPPIVESARYEGGILTLSGKSAPGQSLQLSLRDGENLIDQTLRIATEDATWSLSLPADALPEQGERLALRASTVFLDGRTLSSSDEIIILRGENDAIGVIIVSPGSGSRVLVSPFEKQPEAGALSIQAVDFDDLGGVIITGQLNAPGFVRVYVNTLAIAETGRREDGGWAVIAGNVLPTGTYDLRIVHRDRTTGFIDEVVLPFYRPERGDIYPDFMQTEYSWHIDVPLIGESRQHVVIYGALPQPEEDVSSSIEDQPIPEEETP